jgi:hypothetical protein
MFSGPEESLTLYSYVNAPSVEKWEDTWGPLTSWETPIPSTFFGVKTRSSKLPPKDVPPLAE